MSRRSAGILLFRFNDGRLEVLLVHPGGPLWARRDEHAWSIPKGELAEGEELLAAARREFAEETGVEPSGEAIELQPCRQAGGKVVHAFAMQGDFEPAMLRSNTFALEWPPRSGRYQQVPEVDRAGWFTLEEARVKMNAGQMPLLTDLEQLVARQPRETPR